MIRLRIAAAISSTRALCPPFESVAEVLDFGIAGRFPRQSPNNWLTQFERQISIATVSVVPDRVDWIQNNCSRIPQGASMRAIDISVPVFQGMLHPGRQPEQRFIEIGRASCRERG